MNETTQINQILDGLSTPAIWGVEKAAEAYFVSGVMGVIGGCVAMVLSAFLAVRLGWDVDKARKKINVQGEIIGVSLCFFVMGGIAVFACLPNVIAPEGQFILDTVKMLAR